MSPLMQEVLDSLLNDVYFSEQEWDELESDLLSILGSRQSGETAERCFRPVARSLVDAVTPPRMHH